MSEEESVAIARQRLAAEAEITAAEAAQNESTLLGGVNAARLRNEMTTFTRQAATGAVNTRTIGALIGSLGPALGVAALAGYVLFESLSKSYNASAKLIEDTAKENDELEDQKEKWYSIAAEAQTFADVVRLGEQEVSALDKEAAKLNRTLEKQATFWTKIKNAVFDASAGQAEAANAGITTNGGPSSSDVDQARKAQADALAIQKTLQLKAAIDDAAAASVAFYQKLASEAPSTALGEISGKLQGIAAEEQKLQAVVEKGKSYVPGGDPKDVLAAEKATRQISEMQHQTEKLQAAQKKYGDEIAHGTEEVGKLSLAQRQAALDAQKLAGGDVSGPQHQLSVEEKIVALTKSNTDALKNGAITQAQINALAEQEVTNAEKLKQAHLDVKGAAAGVKLEHQEIAAEIKDEALHLEIIKGLMSAVANDPFATVFEKVNAQLILTNAAITKINKDLATQQASIKGGILDPQQLEAARQKLVQDNLELIKLGQTAKQLSFGGTLRTELVAWANQFGTTAHQIGTAITQSIGTAVSGVSNAITGAIFKTQSWGQAFAQVAQQIVGDIINIVLQWAAQQAVMLVLQAVFGESSASTTATTASEAAAAWAPAATAASIATEGEADIAGTTALIAAMAVGQGVVTGVGAAAGGGFAEGGFTGGIEGRVAGIVHGGEYVLSAPAVRRAGVENLQAFHQNLVRPSYQAGGYVGGGGRASNSRSAARSLQMELHIHHDLSEGIRKFNKSTAGNKQFVSLANRNRFVLGLGT